MGKAWEGISGTPGETWGKSGEHLGKILETPRGNLGKTFGKPENTWGNSGEHLGNILETPREIKEMPQENLRRPRGNLGKTTGKPWKHFGGI